jgi:hypothetical protein
MPWAALVVGILTTSGPSEGRDGLSLPAGVDTIPPTIASAHVIYDPANPEETGCLEFVFSEPVDWFHAISPSNYTDEHTGETAFQGFWFPPDRTQIRFTSGFYGYGTCEQVRVVKVVDLAGNEMVDDGVGNVFTFYLEQLLVKGRMGEHMKSHDAPPHSFAVEGSLEPLTWSPICDVELDDAEGDSTWVQKVFFSPPCSSATGGPETRDLEFRFSHLCSELEPLPADRMVTIDLAAHPDGRDTLDLWWNDEAPPDFTVRDMDVVFRVQAVAPDPPFGAGDSLGVTGSELPLSWDDPPLRRLRDDGVPPDDVASDGVFTTRETFPAGTYRNLYYRCMWKSPADSAFVIECPGEFRTAYLNDDFFSTSNPLVLDLGFGECVVATSAGDRLSAPEQFLLGAIFPNPTRSGVSFSLSVAERTPVTVDVVDVGGRLVRRLARGARPAGVHRLIWDGRTDRGRPSPSGVYFLKVAAGDRTATRRVVLTR